MHDELYGKVAVVTGAASGIGLACAHTLIASGAKVILVDCNQEALTHAHHELGCESRPYFLDLLDQASCEALVPRVLAEMGKVDIFLANAGRFAGGRLVDMSMETIERTLNLNVSVVMKNVATVLPHMISRKTGDIIITSSLSAHDITDREPVYGASKQAVHYFVQAVRKQVFRYGIRIGTVSPGPTQTPLCTDWPGQQLPPESLMPAEEVAEVIHFMLTRRRSTSIQDVIVIPTRFSL